MIPILYAGNRRMFDGLLISVVSAAAHSTQPLDITLLTMDLREVSPDYLPLTENQRQYLERLCGRRCPGSRVTLIDVGDLYRAALADSPNTETGYTPYCFLRLFADRLPLPDKLLYLDVDILFNRDITLLYDMDIEGYEYAAARDHYGKYLVYFNYINAGVLLLNMKEIRRTGLFEKARELIKTKKLPFADQSAIFRSTTRKKMLPQRFNDQKFLHKHTVVRHFSRRLFYLPYPHTANIKQWDVTKVHTIFHYEQFDDVLYEYIYLKRKFERENEIGESQGGYQ